MQTDVSCRVWFLVGQQQAILPTANVVFGINNTEGSDRSLFVIRYYGTTVSSLICDLSKHHHLRRDPIELLFRIRLNCCSNCLNLHPMNFQGLLAHFVLRRRFE